MDKPTNRTSALKYAANYAPYLAVFLLVRFAAEVCMHSCSQLLLVFLPCLLLYVGLSVAVPFYAYSLLKKYQAQEEQVTAYSFTVFLFLFASLIVCLCQYVFYVYISPDYIDNLYQNLLVNIEITAKTYPNTAATLQQLVENTTIPTSLQLATDCIWNNAVAGAVLGLIYAMIIRFKQQKNTTNREHISSDTLV